MQKESLHKSCLAAELAHGNDCADKMKAEVGILRALLCSKTVFIGKKILLGCVVRVGT